jgi:RNA polymerase sigma-70 factor (ECF subfamily)
VLKLLATMVRTQVVNAALHQQAAKRDCRRLAEAGVEERQPVARGLTPSQHVILAELVEKARHLLAPDEWQLLQLRKEGGEWADIARQLGGTPEGLRKQLARAVGRVTVALGLVEANHARSRPGENGDHS